ncbi:FHA domain-containing protein [Actinomadura fulvescens]|uniref:FHA domain-containing protein n=1 Tax=Actinomadura fulvescens TaxID=46160 RepID=A0ABN3QB85_9ACTN
MPLCPRGHDSGADDYCDVCGDLMPAAAPAPALGAGTASGAEECPHCGTPRNGAFCEVDGYDFEHRTLPRAVSPDPGLTGQATQLLQDPMARFAPPPSPSPSPPSSPQRPEIPRTTIGVSSPTGWSVLIAADRDYYETMMALGGPEAAALQFPPYCPDRWIPLIGEQIRIGRRSASRALFPEIDLSTPPEDPGVSHVHAILLAQPDGTWALVDPGSTNGTTVNGATEPIAVNVPVPVGAGDRIHVGAWTTITLFLEGENRR